MDWRFSIYSSKEDIGDPYLAIISPNYPSSHSREM